MSLSREKDPALGLKKTHQRRGSGKPRTWPGVGFPRERVSESVQRRSKMPTRDPISMPSTRTVAVVVDPAKYDTCTSMRWGSSTPIEERPMYIIDSPQSTEDDQDEIGPFLSSRRVGERDITAIRIPTYSFDAIMLIGRGSIGALYVFSH